MPEKEETEQVMIDRQLDLLRNAPAMAFEGFLPLAKELQSQDNPERLIAKALYGFFQWDRDSKNPPSPPESRKPQGNSKGKPQGQRRRRNKKR